MSAHLLSVQGAVLDIDFTGKFCERFHHDYLIYSCLSVCAPWNSFACFVVVFQMNGRKRELWFLKFWQSVSILFHISNISSIQLSQHGSCDTCTSSIGRVTEENKQEQCAKTFHKCLLGCQMVSAVKFLHSQNKMYFLELLFCQKSKASVLAVFYVLKKQLSNIDGKQQCISAVLHCVLRMSWRGAVVQWVFFNCFASNFRNWTMLGKSSFSCADFSSVYLQESIIFWRFKIWRMTIVMYRCWRDDICEFSCYLTFIPAYIAWLRFVPSAKICVVNVRQAVECEVVMCSSGMANKKADWMKKQPLCRCKLLDTFWCLQSLL